MNVVTVVPATDSILILVDSDDGATWWCSACGARGMGRLVSPNYKEEAKRLALSHASRRHGKDER